MSVTSGSSKVFGWFANLTSVAGLMTWFGIGITYVRFYAGMKAQGYDRTKLPYHHWMQPFAGYYVIVATFVICLFSGFNLFIKGGWDTAGFITQYLSLLTFFLLYGVGKYLHRKPIVSTLDMDFQTGLAEIEADTYDEPPPRNAAEKFWQALM